MLRKALLPSILMPDKLTSARGIGDAPVGCLGDTRGVPPCRLGSLLGDLPDWLNLSGVRQACDRGSPWWWRCVWLAVILTGLGFPIYQVRHNLTPTRYAMIAYYHPPIKVKVKSRSRSNCGHFKERYFYAGHLNLKQNTFLFALIE